MFSGDDRLPRQAILTFDAATLRKCDTVTLSLPSTADHFGLLPVLGPASVRPHALLFETETFSRSFLPSLDPMLEFEFFQQHVDADGLIASLPKHHCHQWHFVDWITDWKATAEY
jgi:hypothetical protein